MTDKTDKATWWSVTAFGEEIPILEDVTSYPDWVAQVYGGREVCPNTNREHFQGAVRLHQQQRFSKLKGWLPTAHWEVAQKIEALKKYAMKEQTAAGEKIIRSSIKKFYTAEAICRLITSKVADRQTDRQIQFWHAVNEIIIEDPGMTGQLMNPSLKNFWINTASAWYRLQAAERDSITHVPDDALVVESECMDCDRDTYTCKKCYDKLYNDYNEVQEASEASDEEGQQTDEGGDHESGPKHSASA